MGAEMTQAAIDLRGVKASLPKLPAPFPWFGGKSRVAPIVWQAFGDVHNYVEPFAGSLAVLLGRPTEPKIETVNDIDCYLANFWRALQSEPDAVAKWCDWPVNEADLHARHRWLIEQKERVREGAMTDPHFYDAKVAGWWAWGLCAWIGSGWCAEPSRKLPHLHATGRGLTRKLPNVGAHDRGISRESAPHGDVASWLRVLSARLRRVRVACGDWKRIMGPSVTWNISRGNVTGIAGVFLDPPYSDKQRQGVYSEESFDVATDVRQWAIANGDNPRLRIALCGYEGEHEMPAGWTTVKWKAKGGFGNQRRGGTNDNAGRERIWFSPHCLPLDATGQRTLLETGT